MNSISNKIKFALQESLKEHGGDADSDEDIEIHYYLNDKDISHIDVIETINNLCKELNGSFNSAGLAFFDFLGRGVRYRFDEEEFEFNDEYRGSVAIYEIENGQIASNGPLKVNEYIKIENIEIYFCKFRKKYYIHCTDNKHLEYFEFNQSFLNIEEAQKLFERVKKRNSINLLYWDKKEYSYDSSDNDLEVMEMIKNDTLPDGTVPGYRD